MRAPGLRLLLAVVLALLLGPAGAGASLAAPDGWVWPLSPRPGVERPFQAPERKWLPGHRGVDLAAAPLDVVRSPADGVVSFAGAVAGRPVLSLDHGNGFRTTYEPVRATVRDGDVVTTGQPVGHLMAGHPGCPASACLHWGARVASGTPSGGDDDYVDPLALLSLDSRPIRLKPLRPGDG